jgi:hypothetical protein
MHFKINKTMTRSRAVLTDSIPALRKNKLIISKILKLKHQHELLRNQIRHLRKKNVMIIVMMKFSVTIGVQKIDHLNDV